MTHLLTFAATVLFAAAAIVEANNMNGLNFAAMTDASKTKEGRRYIAQGKNPYIEAFKNQQSDNSKAEPNTADTDHPSHADHLVRKCFCWNNETNNFCGGNDWYNSESCRSWFWQAMAWAFPAIIMFFFFFLFPIFFCAARLCCNCCGGRQPTYGCCCPETHSAHRFRGYSNRTIFFTKFMFYACFGVFIYFGVGAIVTNVKLHSAFTISYNNIYGLVGEMGTTANSVSEAYDTLAAHPYYSGDDAYPLQFVTRPEAAAQADSTQVFDSRVKDIKHILHQVRGAEFSQSHGRFELVFRVISIPLFCFLVVFFLACCNCGARCGGILISIWVLIFSWCAIFVTALFLFHMIWAQGATAICNNFNASFVPAVVGAIRSENGCGNSMEVAGLQRVGDRFVQAIRDPSSEICMATQELCAGKDAPFHCPHPIPCIDEFPRHVATNRSHPTTKPNVNVFGALMERSVMKTSSKRADAHQTSILDCAEGDCSTFTIAYKGSAILNRFYKQYYRNVSYLVDDALMETAGCNRVYHNLNHAVHPILCGDFDRYSTNMAIQGCALCFTLLFTLIFLIRGIKRFIAFGNRERLADVAKRSVYGMDAYLNGAEPGQVTENGSPCSPRAGADTDFGTHSPQEGGAMYGATGEHVQEHPYRAYGDANNDHNNASMPFIANPQMHDRYYPPNSSMAGRPADVVVSEALESKQ